MTKICFGHLFWVSVLELQVLARNWVWMKFEVVLQSVWMKFELVWQGLDEI
jgi:hypothetical protein